MSVDSVGIQAQATSFWSGLRHCHVSSFSMFGVHAQFEGCTWLVGSEAAADGENIHLGGLTPKVFAWWGVQRGTIHGKPHF